MADEDMDEPWLSVSQEDLASRYDDLHLCVTVSRDHIILYANAAATKLLGTVNIVGRSALDFTPARNYESLAEFAGIDKMPMIGRVIHSTVYRDDGSWVDIQIVSRWITLDGKQALLHASSPLHSPDLTGVVMETTVAHGKSIADLKREIQDGRDRLAALEEQRSEDVVTYRGIIALLEANINRLKD